VAQAEHLDRLENGISHLGVTKLLGQKFVAESADAKRIDHQQANCVLAVAAMELETGLNKAFKMAAEYRGSSLFGVVIAYSIDILAHKVCISVVFGVCPVVGLAFDGVYVGRV
jgi:hypothetical protein